MFDNLDRLAQLHECVEAYYCVDCWTAQLVSHDGGLIVAVAEGSNLLEALKNLDSKLQDTKFEQIREGWK